MFMSYYFHNTQVEAKEFANIQYLVVVFYIEFWTKSFCSIGLM